MIAYFDIANDNLDSTQIFYRKYTREVILGNLSRLSETRFTNLYLIGKYKIPTMYCYYKRSKIKPCIQRKNQFVAFLNNQSYINNEIQNSQLYLKNYLRFIISKYQNSTTLGRIERGGEREILLMTFGYSTI